MDLSELVAIVPHDGGTHRYVCPACSPVRRKQNMKDLAVTRSDDALKYTCHHCGETGVHVIMERKMNVVRTPVVKTELTDQHVAFLKDRGISLETANKAGLFGSRRWFKRLNAEADCIAFPYYKDGNIESCKYRSITGKDFTQDAGGAHTFWRIDDIDLAHPVVIVEGEIDALTLMEIGVPNAISVPSGAPIKVVDGKVSAKEDKRFSFVWDGFDKLAKAPHIVLATDNDPPGHALAEELARRLGKDRCRIAKLPEKDANEVLQKQGADALRDAILKAEPYPVQGVNSAKDFEDRLNDLFQKGTGKGFSTGYPMTVDALYTVVPGQMTVVTGYPSMGKSNFVDQIMVNLARSSGWKFALCSFENAPEVHISRLIEIYTNRRFFDGENRISPETFQQALNWVNDHFVFLTNESSEPATIGSIIERAKAAVARMGVRGLLIDPYNYIELDRGESETAAISSMLTRVQQFAKNSGVHVWFVAHPAKINRQGMDLPRPDGMAISGSMAWWAKTDCGVTVHRVKNDTQIAVWKCRYRWVGQTGETLLKYDKATGTYSEPKDFF